MHSSLKAGVTSRPRGRGAGARTATERWNEAEIRGEADAASGAPPSRWVMQGPVGLGHLPEVAEPAASTSAQTPALY